jgi:nucleoporin NUP159
VDPYRDEDSPYLSIQRLKDFPPNLQDLLIVGSQATPDMGVISRSKISISIYSNEESTANVFTTTEIDDDDRRISLPLSQTMDFSVAIGTALDLSARGTVRNPTEETEESPGPVPGYWVLTNDGIIYAWWVIYSESITDGTAYPGLTFLDVVKPNR